MSETAKIFMNGRSQAVRLPAKYRFDAKEVFIRQDARTGDVILSARPRSWDGLIAAIDTLQPGDIPDDFLTPEGRDQGTHDRDPFEGWEE